jgi:hypothetical protein
VIACNHSADLGVLRILIHAYPISLSLPKAGEYPEGTQEEEVTLVGLINEGSHHQLPLFYFLKAMENWEETASLTWKRGLFEKLSWGTLQAAIACGSLLDEQPPSSSFCPWHEWLRFLSRCSSTYLVLDVLLTLCYRGDHEPAMFWKREEQKGRIQFTCWLLSQTRLKSNSSITVAAAETIWTKSRHNESIKAIIQFLLDVSPKSAYTIMSDANGICHPGRPVPVLLGGNPLLSHHRYFWRPPLSINWLPLLTNVV